MKKFKFKIKEKTFDVEIMNIEDNMAEVQVNGKSFSVEVDKTIQVVKTPILVREKVSPDNNTNATTARTSSPSEPKGAGVLKSPLPGTILDIFVSVGDTVKVGQKVICLEAMKMENNINANKEGKVTAIKVQKGDAVLEGHILVEIN
ncbi:MAG TPA: acetyl-CoA carboxylase biotin carboxyl carrier protein subunit [Bacteroidales bacterium]|nr:acetyl-CoA carboxylase biotin carboxyl carrier protein subunit [Bacteroidales bacterium]HQI44570.1 acetyl-CoA carboxylase biotin carboxyl carrier protein subunit [Bacteroidales bacterium]